MQKNDTLQEAWYKMCMNTEHPNSLICPDPGTDLFFPVDNDPRQEECCSARQYTQELRLVKRRDLCTLIDGGHFYRKLEQELESKLRKTKELESKNKKKKCKKGKKGRKCRKRKWKKGNGGRRVIKRKGKRKGKWKKKRRKQRTGKRMMCKKKRRQGGPKKRSGKMCKMKRKKNRRKNKPTQRNG